MAKSKEQEDKRFMLSAIQARIDAAREGGRLQGGLENLNINNFDSYGIDINIKDFAQYLEYINQHGTERDKAELQNAGGFINMVIPEMQAFCTRKLKEVLGFEVDFKTTRKTIALRPTNEAMTALAKEGRDQQKARGAAPLKNRELIIYRAQENDKDDNPQIAIKCQLADGERLKAHLQELGAPIQQVLTRSTEVTLLLSAPLENSQLCIPCKKDKEHELMELLGVGDQHARTSNAGRLRFNPDFVSVNPDLDRIKFIRGIAHTAVDPTQDPGNVVGQTRRQLADLKKTMVQTFESILILAHSPQAHEEKKKFDKAASQESILREQLQQELVKVDKGGIVQPPVDHLVKTALGKAANYSTEFRPAMVNNGQRWAPDPGGKQDIVLVFSKMEDAQVINQKLNDPPYSIGGQGRDGMKVINPEDVNKFTIKLSQDNIQAIISNGLAQEALHPAQAMQDAFKKKGAAPQVAVPHVKKEGAAAGVGF